MLLGLFMHILITGMKFFLNQEAFYTESGIRCLWQFYGRS